MKKIVVLIGLIGLSINLNAIELNDCKEKNEVLIKLNPQTNNCEDVVILSTCDELFEKETGRLNWKDCGEQEKEVKENKIEIEDLTMEEDLNIEIEQKEKLIKEKLQIEK